MVDIVPPSFWEWFNIWLSQFLEDFYDEIKMVALRGSNSSMGSVRRGCGVSGGGAREVSHSLQISLSMPHGGSVGAHRGTHSNMQTFSNVSVQFISQNSVIKHESSHFANTNCRLPSHHYRNFIQPRPECYHSSGAAGGAYMPSVTGAQSSQTLRGQPAPQPSAPPAPQQDMSKTTMAGPSYGAAQNQTPQPRPQYPNFQYRAPQHGNRPASHPRQQQPYMSGAGSPGAGPVMYHPTLVFQPPHMGLPQSYPQQQRSNTPGYYPYMTQYISYTTPANPSPYYYPNGQQMGAGGGVAGARAAGPLVPPPAPSAPSAPAPHQQPQPHLHQTLPGVRQVPSKRTSHRLAIINPLTKQDIFSELSSNDSQNLSGDSSERQTPQPDRTQSIVEEFSRKITEAANQPSASESASKNAIKVTKVPAASAIPNQPHTNALISINSNNNLINNLVKSEINNVNDSKVLGPDVVQSTETPVVSAISDSPVVVPKMPMVNKLIPKTSEQIQPLVVDNKTVAINKQSKQTSKPIVPQEQVEKQSDTSANTVPPQVEEPHTVAPVPNDVEAETLASTTVAAPVFAPTGVSAPILAPTSVAPASIAPVSVAPAAVAPASVALASVAPASVAPASVPPASVPPTSVPPASVPSASVPSASLPPASVAPVSVAPASVAPASVAPAFVIPASVAPPFIVPASVAPPFVVPASVAPPFIVPASVAPPFIVPASVAPAFVSLTPSPLPEHSHTPSLVPASAPSLVPSTPAPAAPVEPPPQVPAVVTTPPLQPTTPTPAPQPQRIREPRERVRSEDKTKPPSKGNVVPENDTPQHNGPTSDEISSVGSAKDTIKPSTSQVNRPLGKESNKAVQQLLPVNETDTTELNNPEVVINKEFTFPKLIPTATELLSASIEKVITDQFLEAANLILQQEESITLRAQTKLAQSLASVSRNQGEPKMKDINLNNETGPDPANGNTTVESVKDELKINEKALKNSNNDAEKMNKVVASEECESKVESYENGKDETDKVNIVEPEDLLVQEEEDCEATEMIDNAAGPSVFVPKYKYSEDQWSPLNKDGKKYYNIELLMLIKDDPQSKNKPDVPLLEACNVMRTTPIQEPIFSPITRPTNDAFYPNFSKASGAGPRSSTPKDMKKDGRMNMVQSGKGSVKLPSASGSGAHKAVIHVSLSLREEVKLNQSNNAWKPTRLKRDSLTEEDYKTQDLNKKFRGILNKLTPQKFDTLLERVKALEINTQSRLEGIINLIFEKAIDEPNFSEAYAAMCSKLSMLKVPANNAPDRCVNFRALIICRCQSQFVTEKVDEQVQKLERELAECTDPVKSKELHLMLEEENRRVRMRSVGNVRFIGELYKLKMLTAKIMVYCMNYLIEKLQEEKLECLCKLLTTIGEQVENEIRGELDSVFKKMQDIVERKFNKISSRVRFMIQDVIELRKRKWVVKNVVDSQPKMMDQIQKEAEQQQRHIELMNSGPMGGGGGGGGGGFRQDGGRGKRGDGRRNQGGNAFMDNSWKATRTSYTVDTSKLMKVVTGTQKNLNSIKLAPSLSAWNHGSGTKNTAQANSNSMISLSKNMYSVLENVQADPSSLSIKDLSSNYQHSKSIERSTFNSRGDFNSGSGSRAGSIGGGRNNAASPAPAPAPVPVVVVAPTPARASAPAPAPAPAPATAPTPAFVAQQPLPAEKCKAVKMIIMDHLINPTDDGIASEVRQLFPAQYHSNLVAEILNITIDKSGKEIQIVVKLLIHLVSSNTISAPNLVTGIAETLDLAPDLYIDIPMLYDYLGKLIASTLEKKYVTFTQVLGLCENIIASNHGHLLLKSIIRNMKESMGPTFVKTKWDDCGLQLKQWMNEEQVPKWIEENKFEFLEGGTPCEETNKILTPSETQSKLLQLMNSEESFDCIRGWVQDNLGSSSKEDWFMRALTQAICEHALYGAEARDAAHFSQERMGRHAPLVHEFGESREAREASCLLAIQQLIHRLEHPQGLTLEIFQYLHEQYIISVDGFIAWEMSEKEPEGKAVMLKALTSFFTNIKEADNEDSCSED